MPVCGCGESLAGAPPIIDGGIGDDQGIIVSGTFDNTVITAVSATAWRPFDIADVDIVNFTLGDGEFEGRFLDDGFNVDIIMSFRFGAGSTFAASPWNITTDYIPQEMTGVIRNHAVLGYWSAFDASAGSPWYQGTVAVSASGDFEFRFGDDIGASNTLLQQGTPFTFTNQDEFSFQVRFEADSN